MIGVQIAMRLPTSYNRLRAALAREQASKTFVVEHRQHYLRLAFQYDAIAALEAEATAPDGARTTACRDRRLTSQLSRF
ncbi:hypothetical protein [Brevundimonas vancanneytii]|uniref:hypothetical protein n=1 Tax=Brevundimonas vancanneytii TaxID=1325724 RepID=UPI00209564DB|nr:hypothetical protein [Brevundimonas vancanneytii]